MVKTFTRCWLSLAFILGISVQSYATHIMGSDISYRCLGGNNYRIVVTLYRDCSGIPVPNSISVSVQSACGDTIITCNQDVNLSGAEVSQLCPSAISTCHGGALPGVEVYTYIGDIT